MSEAAPQPGETLECRTCGARSTWKEGYRESRTLTRRACTVCVTCAAYRQKYTGYYVSWLLAAALGIGFGYKFTASLKLGVVMATQLYLSTYLGLLVHELGHAAAATLVGVRVIAVSVGDWSRLKAHRVGGLLLLLSPLPSRGRTYLQYRSHAHYRKREAILTAAGPLANLVAGAAGAHVLTSYANGLPESANSLVFWWTVINVLLGLGNLLPFTKGSGFEQIRSDGQRLLTVSRRSGAEIETNVRRGGYVGALIEYCFGSKELALAAISHPAEGLSSEEMTLLSAVFADTGRLDESASTARRCLARDDLKPVERAMLENNLAYVLYLKGEQSGLTEADALSSSAYEFAPMLLPVRGTRGAVLIARGAWQAGVELLSDRRFRMETRRSRAAVCCNLAIGHAELGNVAEAQRALARARDLDSAHPQLLRAETVVQGKRSKA